MTRADVPAYDELMNPVIQRLGRIGCAHHHRQAISIQTQFCCAKLLKMQSVASLKKALDVQLRRTFARIYSRKAYSAHNKRKLSEHAHQVRRNSWIFFQ
jgi:hypothetical protein